MKTKTRKPLGQLITNRFGKEGAETRDDFERGYEEFKLGTLIQEALEKGVNSRRTSEKVGLESCKKRIENKAE